MDSSYTMRSPLKRMSHRRGPLVGLLPTFISQPSQLTLLPVIVNLGPTSGGGRGAMLAVWGLAVR